MDRSAPKIPIPQNILANLTPGERVLFADKGVQYNKSQKVTKWVFIGMFGILAVVAGISFPRLFEHLDDEMNLLSFLMIPLAFIIGIVFLKKNSFTTTTLFFVTDRKVYSVTSMKMMGPNRDFSKSFELNKLQAIGVRNYKLQPDGISTGTIDLYSEQANASSGYKLSLPNVTNVAIKLKILESIAWHFGKKLVITSEAQPFRIQLDLNFVKKTIRRAKLCMVILVASLTAVGLGITGTCIFNVPFARGHPVPPELQVPFAMEMISIFVFATGIALFLVLGLWMGIATHTVQGSPDISGLDIAPDYLQFRGAGQTPRIPFDRVLFLNVIHPRVLGMTSVITFTTPGDLVSPLRFGPIESYFESLEKIYQAILGWKARNDQLFSVADLETNAGDLLSRVPDQAPVSKEIQANPPIVENSSPSAEINAEDKALLEKYLEPGEQFIYAYKPVVNVNRQLLLGLVGVGGMILLILVMMNMNALAEISFLLFIGVFVGSTLLFVFGLFGWCMFAGAQVTKNTLYTFTNRKMLLKYPRRVVSVKYGNISLIEKRESRGKCTLEIGLFKPLDSSGRIPTTVIYIPSVPKISDLFARIKALREQFTVNQP